MDIEKTTGSAGGGRFASRFFDFEAIPDGDLGGGAAPAPAPEPALAPAPAAPSWSPSRDEWEQTQAFQNELLRVLQEPDEPVAPQPQGIDPALEARAQQIAEQQITERLGPYQPFLDGIAEEKTNAMILDGLKKLGEGDPANGAQGLGTFDYEKAAPLVKLFFDQTGNAQQALEAAARHAIGWEKSVRESAQQGVLQVVQNRVDAPVSPTAPGAAQQGDDLMARHPNARDKYEAISLEWEAKRRAGATTQIG